MVGSGSAAGVRSAVAIDRMAQPLATGRPPECHGQRVSRSTPQPTDAPGRGRSARGPASCRRLRRTPMLRQPRSKSQLDGAIHPLRIS